MTGVEIPRRVRVATLFIRLMAPAGLLLVLDGLWELRWWGSARSHHLVALLSSIKKEFGTDPPALLRGHFGAWELIVLGLLTMAPAFFARSVRQGDRGARSWVYGLSIASLVLGVLFIGSDAAEPIDLHMFLQNMHQGIAADQIPAVQAAMYPGWYQWAEDIAQGLQVLVAVLAIGTLAAAVIALGEWTSGQPADEPAGDAWDDAITRLHQRTVGETDDRR
jgi:hypothetical protein